VFSAPRRCRRSLPTHPRRSAAPASRSRVDDAVGDQPDAGEPLQRRAVPACSALPPALVAIAGALRLDVDRSAAEQIVPCSGRVLEAPDAAQQLRLTIGPGSSGAGSPRSSHSLPVPSLVDRAAPSGVVPAELGGAAVLGAGSGFAEGAHHRSGAGGAASAIASRHGHAWIVPRPKQGKRFSAWPYPPVGSLWSCGVG
jgi:hypothetical protein